MIIKKLYEKGLLTYDDNIIGKDPINMIADGYSLISYATLTMNNEEYNGYTLELYLNGDTTESYYEIVCMNDGAEVWFSDPIYETMYSSDSIYELLSSMIEEIDDVF